MKAPRAAGMLLRALAWLVESPITGPMLAEKFYADAGLALLRDAPVAGSPPPIHPLHAWTHAQPPTPALATVPWAAAPRPTEGFAFETSGDFLAAYQAGRTTPADIARAVVAATRAQAAQPLPINAIVAQVEHDVLAQGSAATGRFAAKLPWSAVDGLPIAIKDELDMCPYPTGVGTSFMGRTGANADAAVVAKLRGYGALLIGKAHMHEIGMGTTGVNPHCGPARNPYNPAHVTGGSSSGPAAAVASGLCPIAIGADAGGSIRIPAALCGVVGLKPTFGRVSGRGTAEICWSVGQVGPLGATVADVALAYMLIAGPDPREPLTQHQPAPTIAGWDTPDLAGVRLGVFRPWFEDAEPAVVAACQALLDALVARGATVVEIAIPELGLLAAAHTVTIAAEIAASQHVHVVEGLGRYSPELRFQLALARRLPGRDYVQAQRVRPRLFAHFMAAFNICDAIVTPTTACVAPLIQADSLETGDSNLEQLDRLMRFARPANLTGLPAITVPAGYDPSGLPIGFQAMGRPWDEALLLRIGRVAEGCVVRRAPQQHVRLLP